LAITEVSFARCQPYHCLYYLPLVLACHYPNVHPYSTFSNIAVIHWR